MHVDVIMFNFFCEYKYNKICPRNRQSGPALRSTSTASIIYSFSENIISCCLVCHVICLRIFVLYSRALIGSCINETEQYIVYID